MTEQVISPLRRRMIEDMTIRKFGQKTQHDYVRRVKEFAKPPESIPRYTRTGRCTRFSVASEVERRRHAEDQRHRRGTVVSAGSLAGPASSSPCACSRACRLVLEKLAAAHRAGQLQSFGKHAELTRAQAFAAYLAPLRNRKWVVYSKRPFGGPAEALRYLARYTHRVAISNRRLVVLNDKGVTFKWKDYRLEGRERYGVMMLDTHEFIRRFLMHLLPQGFHRIPCYGLLTSPTRANNITRIGALLTDPLIPIAAIKAATTKPEEPQPPEHPCPYCGQTHAHHRDLLAGANRPDDCPTPPPAKIRIDTS